jgi:hypothetical protein
MLINSSGLTTVVISFHVDDAFHLASGSSEMGLSSWVQFFLIKSQMEVIRVNVIIFKDDRGVGRYLI